MRKRHVLAALAVLVAIAAGWLWFAYPAHRIERALAKPRMPAGIELTNEEISDNGWFCIDSCSWGSRYYVSTMPSRETADAVAAALRDAGWTAEVTTCTGTCEYGDFDPYSLAAVEWDVWVRGNGLSGAARVGRRVDGRTGVDLTTGA